METEDDIVRDSLTGKWNSTNHKPDSNNYITENYYDNGAELPNNLSDEAKSDESINDSSRNELDEDSGNEDNTSMSANVPMDASIPSNSGENYVLGESEIARQYAEYLANRQPISGNSDLTKQYQEYLASQQECQDEEEEDSNPADPYTDYILNRQQFQGASEEDQYQDDKVTQNQHADTEVSEAKHNNKESVRDEPDEAIEDSVADNTNESEDSNTSLAKQYMEYMAKLQMLEELKAGMSRNLAFEGEATEEKCEERKPKRRKLEDSFERKGQEKDSIESQRFNTDSMVKKPKYRSERAKLDNILKQKEANEASLKELQKSGNNKSVKHESNPIVKQYVQMAAIAAPLLSDADDATADDEEDIEEDEVEVKVEDDEVEVKEEEEVERKREQDVELTKIREGTMKETVEVKKEELKIPEPDMATPVQVEPTGFNLSAAGNSMMRQAGMMKPAEGEPGSELLTPMEIYSNLLIQMEATGELLGPPLESFEKAAEGTPKPAGPVEKVKRFACSECNKEYATSSSLRKHMYSHCEEKPHKCQYCNKGFTESSSLKSHEYIHTGEKPLKCHFCNQGFRSPSNLRRHFRVHTGEKPFKCEVCGKEFSQTVRLQSHMLLHTGETPYKCKYCSKGFRTPNQLNSHHRTHTGERPFKCSMCDKTFSDSSNLRTHVRRHIGDKPHECEVCHVLFGFISDLKRHMLTHTKKKPFICPHCNKGFTQSYTLNAHLAIHTGKGLHTCPVCDRNFTTGTNLRRHLLRHPQYLEANPDVAAEVQNSTAGGPRHSVMRIYETAAGEQSQESVPNGVISANQTPGSDEVTSKIVDSVLAEAYALSGDMLKGKVDSGGMGDYNVGAVGIGEKSIGGLGMEKKGMGGLGLGDKRIGGVGMGEKNISLEMGERSIDGHGMGEKNVVGLGMGEKSMGGIGMGENSMGGAVGMSPDGDGSVSAENGADIQSMVNRLLGQSMCAKDYAPFANNEGT